jgi:hypothetical protein
MTRKMREFLLEDVDEYELRSLSVFLSKLVLKTIVASSKSASCLINIIN